jgi:hypothetical protein
MDDALGREVRGAGKATRDDDVRDPAIRNDREEDDARVFLDSTKFMDRKRRSECMRVASEVLM